LRATARNQDWALESTPARQRPIENPESKIQNSKMPQLKERPSALLDAAPRSRRDSSYALLEDLDSRDRRRSTGVGIVLTIVVWLLCFWLFNQLITRISEQHAAGTASAATRPKPKFDIELQDDSFEMPQKPPPPPQQFVETNPDAPENIPDKTNNFAAQNQQAAQEKPDPTGKNDRAATEGKKDWESNQIVSGELRQPTIPIPPAPPPTPEVQPDKAVNQPPPVQREQVPLTGDQKIQGDSASGYGMTDIKPPDHTTAKPNPDLDQLIKGTPNATDDTGLPQLTVPQIDPHHPQPRPRIAKNVRPAVLADNKIGTPNIGPSGYDAKWNNYGAYLQKFIDTVQIQWDDLNDKSKIYPPTGTKISVHFRIDSEGKIAEIIDTDGSNGGTQATRICISAITDRAPYGKWTDDMIAMLGDSQEMTFTFYYGMP